MCVCVCDVSLIEAIHVIIDYCRVGGVQIVASLADSPGFGRQPWQINDAVAIADEFGGESAVGLEGRPEDAPPPEPDDSEVEEA